MSWYCLLFVKDCSSLFLINIIHMYFFQQTKNFTSLCRHDPLKNASSTGPHRTSCKIDASIILPSRKLVLFSNSLVLMYGSYHDLEIGPYSSRRIPDLFPGIVGPVDAAFDDNTYVYIVQGMVYI